MNKKSKLDNKHSEKVAANQVEIISTKETVSSPSVLPKDLIPSLSTTSKRHLENASILLALATGIAILFGLSMALLPGGNDAVPAMGGVLKATAPMQTAQIVFLLDILFPITFGAGFALFATAFQTRGNRSVVRMILTALLLVVLYSESLKI